jgi:hypothetical protein
MVTLSCFVVYGKQRGILKIAGFSKNDSVLARVSGDCPSPTGKGKFNFSISF